MIPCYGFGDGNCILGTISILPIRSCNGELTIELQSLQHLHMIKMSLAFTTMTGSVMDLRKFCIVTKKSSPTYDLQVIVFLFRLMRNVTIWLTLGLVLTSCRTYIFCTNHWDGHDNSWANWWSVPCFADNCRWAGESGFERASRSPSIFDLIETNIWKNSFCILLVCLMSKRSFP